MKRGFTLAEVIVVMAVLAVIGTVVLAIFIRTLRGTNKAQILSAIKQNGQSVLENMDKTIRGSDNVVCPVANFSETICKQTQDCSWKDSVCQCSSKNLVIRSRGIYTRYRFTAPSPSTNGLIQQDGPTKQIDPKTNKEETDPVFVNRVCILTDPEFSPPIVLTDTKTDTGVSVDKASFTRRSQPGFKDTVTIEFDLNAGVKAPQVVAGQIDPVTFQTTIELR